MALKRPAYKHHPLWTEAIALTEPPAASADLPRRAQAMDGSVALALGLAEDEFLC